VRKNGKRLSITDQLVLQGRRNKLQTQIEAFTEGTLSFLGEADVEAPEYTDDYEADSDYSDESASEADLLFHTPVHANEQQIAQLRVQPESTPLPLPSSLGTSWCSDPLNHTLVKQEIGLRVGQANDALHEIRIALAHKSFLYRTSVRNANSQQMKTRAWDDVHAVQAKVGKHVRVYSQARRALVNLNAPEDVLARFQVLRREHLKISTAVVDVRLPHRSDAALAWFWNLDISGDTESLSWMAECTSILP
jgi:hypothetical protein